MKNHNQLRLAGRLIRTLVLSTLLVSGIFLNRVSVAFTNSIYGYADPFLTYANGSYYLLGTDSGWIKVVSSTNLEGLSSGTVASVYNEGGFFESPEMYWMASYGHWYIYYTQYPNTVIALESDTTNPQGTYHYKATLTSNTYDATVAIIHGSLYLVSSDYQNIVIQPMSNPWTAGGQSAIAGLTQSWESGAIEAPEVAVNPAGTYFLFYSSGIYSNNNYAEGALKLTGNDPTVAANWSKLAGPIFKGDGNNGDFATATCSPFMSPDGSQYWFAFGGYNQAGARTTRAQPMSWNSDGTPNLGSPIPLGLVITDPQPVFGDFNLAGGTDYALYNPSATNNNWNVRSSLTGNILSFSLGQPGDIPLIGNWSLGVGCETAVFRPSTGMWYVRFYDGNTGSFSWGANGDIPLIGAWSGMMRDEVVFRPSNGAWYIRFGDTGKNTTVYWGGGTTNTNDVPLVGNFGGNGMIDQVIYRPASGEWFVRDGKLGTVMGSFYWGGGPGYTTDIPMIGAWSGRMRDAAIFRPSTAEWYVRFGDTGGEASFQFGEPGDQPMIGNIFGHGMVDQIVYRPSTGMWYVRDGTNGNIYSFAFGTSQDALIHE